MPLNGAILARARESLAQQHEENLEEQSRRTGRVYARSPRVAQIDADLRRQMARLAALTFSRETDAAAKIAALSDANLALQAERADILRQMGLPSDYLDEVYSCRRCRDTGYVGAEMCECLRREYNAELTRELSGLLRDDGESFDKFNLNYYSDAPGADGRSPREIMEFVYNTCRLYALNFSRTSPSLIFRGGPGLGKTFLSACIAREVATRGFSVAYESAPTALGQFELQRFSRDAAEAEAAAGKVREYLSCDLMLLDDLGTEMKTSFSVSALYQLINERLTAGRQTIISTNLYEAEIEERYGGQISSRLAGEYDQLVFAGSDIRRLKKERSL